MNRKTPITALLISLGLSACTLMPNYETPTLPVDAAWPAGVSSPQARDQQSERAVHEIGWRRFFEDDTLQALISLALNNNRDLRAASLTVERLEALYRIQRADLLPKVNLVGQENAQRVSDDLRAPNAQSVTHQYAVGLSISAFELDFFGRLRSLSTQAFEQYLATDAARQSAQISLISQVVSTYANWVADQEHLRVAEATLKTQQEAYTLIERSFKAGIVSELTLRQAQTTVETARIDLARYTSLVAQDENMLTSLLGTPLPPELRKTRSLSELKILNQLPVGLSSNVLLNRPDVVQAEHLLKAANANIGAARAAFFPSIMIFASNGTASTELDGLFNVGTRTWTFTPQITLPIFQAGRNIANLDAATLQRDIQIAQYEKVVQTAFREVADALADRNTLTEQLQAQTRLLEASSASYRLSSERFRLGIGRYLEVLDSQRLLYASEQNLINQRLAEYRNRILLYKALGGGLLEKTSDTTVEN